MNFFIELQTPTVEIPVMAKDAGGIPAKIIVGFKRYEAAEGFEKAKEFSKLVDGISPEDGKEGIQKVSDAIAEEIIYLRDVKLKLPQENGKFKERRVLDTRTEKDEPELWGAADNCLPKLLSKYLSSTPWRSSFITALYSAFTNTQLGQEAEVKN
jgi:hypothetical protein